MRRRLTTISHTHQLPTFKGNESDLWIHFASDIMLVSHVTTLPSFFCNVVLPDLSVVHTPGMYLFSFSLPRTNKVAKKILYSIMVIRHSKSCIWTLRSLNIGFDICCANTHT